MDPTPNRPGALLACLRPRQWVKNVLLFGGLAFTGRWHQASSGQGWAALLNWLDIGHSVAAFVVFCLLSSAGYVINDIHDVEQDRRHPRKCKRPIAAGTVTVTAGWALAVVCFTLGLGWSYWLGLRGGQTTYFLVTAVCYAVLTNWYSFQLKSFVIIDVLCLGILFVLRAIAGCYVIPEPPSPWIVVCTLFGALFIGLCKRRAELSASPAEGRGETRSVLAKYHTATGYSEALLDQMIQMAGTATILTYSLYTFFRPQELGATAEQTGLMFTIPFVVYGVFRYLYLVHKQDIGQRPEALFGDRAMLLNLLLWGLVAVFVTRGRRL